MSRSECPQEQEWPLFSLGVMDADRCAELQRHLDEGCPQCLSAHREWAGLVPLIGLSAPERKPSPGVEARLQERLFAPRQPRVKTPTIFAWSAAVAALVLVAVVFVELEIRRRDLAQALAREDQKVTILENEAAHLRTVVAKSPAVVPDSQVHPAALPKPPAVLSSRKTEPAPAALGPAPLVAPERSAADRETTGPSREETDLSERLSASEKQRQLLEDRLQAAEERNRQLQESASSALDLHGEVERLRSELHRSNNYREDYQRLLSIVGTGPVRSVELRAIDPAAGGASARAILSGKSGLFLIADRMPALPSNKCYQLWLIRKANPSIVSGGIMQLNASGVAVLAVPNLDTAMGVTGLAITDEPAGGSVSAKGHKLLFGAL